MDGQDEFAPGQRLMRFLVAVALGAVAIGFVAIKGCQAGPFGRKQIVNLSETEQAALGAQAYQQVLHDPKTRVVARGPIVRAVQDVTDRLVAATRNPNFLRAVKLPERNFDWQVQVLESPEVNAFCLPGGKMVVYTGILPVCKTDAGLATVMGHEISHALGQHGAERMSQAKMAQIGVSAAGAGVGGSPQEQARVMQLLNAGAKFGILKYSRDHETEADHVGLFLMATAGYDPEQAIQFWERMKAQASGGRQPEFLSTHPNHETRIRDLTRWIPDAMPLYRASGHAGERPKRLPLE